MENFSRQNEVRPTKQAEETEMIFASPLCWFCCLPFVRFACRRANTEVVVEPF